MTTRLHRKSNLNGLKTHAQRSLPDTGTGKSRASTAELGGNGWYAHGRVGNGRSIRLDARVQWRQTLASSGTVFDASFVGLDEWRPLTGVGLSRHSAVLGLDLNAKPSANTRVKLGYEYLTGDRGQAGVATANFTLRF